MSAYIPESVISEIEARTNIVELISDYVPLKKAGRNHKGLCPFHKEKTPSFTVTEDRGIFYCFGCQVGGNVFSFLMRMENVSFPEAVRDLGKRCGVVVPDRDASDEEEAKGRHRELLYGVNRLAGKYYYHILMHEEEGKAGREYLERREIPLELAGQFKLGYAIDAWDGLLRFLKEKGVPQETAAEVGLLMPKRGGGHYDRFRGRLMFPIIDERGRVNAFGGRAIGKGPAAENTPKYLNSPESEIYSKRSSLYGIEIAKRAMREMDAAIIVEGYLDLIRMHQHGFKHTAATLGTALTPDHIRIMKRYAGKVFLLFDSDNAGLLAAERSLELFLNQKMATRIVQLPSGHDPDSLLREVSRESFERYIDQAPPLFEFILGNKMTAARNETVEIKAQIAESMIPMLRKVHSRIERDLYIKKMAEILNLDESVIRREIKIPSRPDALDRRSGPTDPASPPTPGRIPRAEEAIIELVLTNHSIAGKARMEDPFAFFSNELMRRVGRYALEYLEDHDAVDPAQLMERVEDDALRAQIARLSCASSSAEPSVALKIYEDSLLRIRLDQIRNERRLLQSSLREAEQADDREQATRILSQMGELIHKEKELMHEQAVEH